MSFSLPFCCKNFGGYPATRLPRGILRAGNNLRDAIHEARARAFSPRRPGAIHTILLQMPEAFVTDVAGGIMVTTNGHATVRTGDGFDTERLLAQIRTTAGANLG